MIPQTCKLVTLGCKVNQYESQYFRELLEWNGVVEAGEGQPADLCLINTCTVTHEADAKGRQAVRKLHKENPAAIILVTGCYAERDPSSLRKIPGVTQVEGGKGKFLDLLADLGLTKRPPNISRFDNHQRAFLKVQDGCLLNCSYCIIPKVRPSLQSRPPDLLIREALDIAASGYHEIVLTGIHLGHYGIDLSKGKPKAQWTRLWHLLAMLCEAVPGVRFRLSSLDAAEARDELIQFLSKEPRVVPHLHLCLQSGSDKVLLGMKRRYSRQGFMDRCEKIRQALDHPGFSTDVIVGFPGETENDFQATADLIKDVGFFQIHVFPYSPREGTPAYELGDPIPSDVKASRRLVLEQIEKENLRKYQDRLMGKKLEVLVESQADGKEEWVAGTSCRGVRVELPGYLEAIRKKTLPVEVKGTRDGTLWGLPLGGIEFEQKVPRSRQIYSLL